MKISNNAGALSAAVFFLAITAQASPAKVHVKTEYAKAQTEFTDACRESFRKSTTPTPEETSKTLCECTAKDAKSQGASAKALRKEAGEIKKDSKHEIADEHIMNAFRACTIEMMKKTDEESTGERHDS